MQAVKYSAVNTSVPSAAAFISEIYPPPILYKVSSHAFISAHREHRITRPRALWQKSLMVQNTAAVGHQRFGSASDAGRERREIRHEEASKEGRRADGWILAEIIELIEGPRDQIEGLICHGCVWKSTEGV